MISEDFFKYNIGIIGAGHIGQALALKLRDIGFPTDNLKLSYNGSIFTFSDLYDNELVDNIADNSKIVDTSDIIIVSVPPQMFMSLYQFGQLEYGHRFNSFDDLIFIHYCYLQ